MNAPARTATDLAQAIELVARSFTTHRRAIFMELLACERADAVDAEEYLAAAERLGALASDEHSAAEDQWRFYG